MVWKEGINGCFTLRVLFSSAILTLSDKHCTSQHWLLCTLVCNRSIWIDSNPVMNLERKGTNMQGQGVFTSRVEFKV